MFSHILQTIILSLLLRNTLAAPIEAVVPSTNATGTYKAPVNARDGGSAPPKLVVAHMVVGNTYSYSVDTWAADIKLASANGIDGFALNIGSAAPFTDTQVANAFQAAAQFPDFKLFYSFDMTVTGCASDTDGVYLRNKVTKYSSSPNMLKVNNKVFVSTFAGDGCSWGVNGWKAQLTAHPDMTGSNGVFFVPSFFTDPTQFGQYKGVIDGMFNFNGGWVTAPNDQYASDPAAQIGGTASDQAYISGLAATGDSPFYMTAASPWFFTHFGANTYNKNWIYDADQWMWASRFEKLIADQATWSKTNMLEIVTWNDFGESHYLNSPHSQGDVPPGADQWTNGFDHSGWLKMTSFLAQGFKTGSFPTPSADQLVLWARPHPAAAKASADGVPPPTNAQYTKDTLWAVAILASPATVTLDTGNGQTKSFDGKVGLNKFSLDLAPGSTMAGTIVRGSDTVATVKPQGFTFNPNPQTYNFNAFVASS